MNELASRLNFFPSERPSFLEGSNSVAIIGNGASATRADLGEQINRFDLVVRINNYVTAGHERQLGSKTDIWVNGANQGLQKRKIIPENTLVMIPPVVLEEKGDAIHPRIQRRLGSSNYELVDLKDMQALESWSGLERLTTGLFSILYFYHAGFELSIHGFDFFVGSKSHYFDSALKRWFKESGLIRKATKHDITAEKELVERLIDQGALARLGS